MLILHHGGRRRFIETEPLNQINAGIPGRLCNCFDNDLIRFTQILYQALVSEQVQVSGKCVFRLCQIFFRNLNNDLFRRTLIISSLCVSIPVSLH